MWDEGVVYSILVHLIRTPPVAMSVATVVYVRTEGVHTEGAVQARAVNGMGICVRALSLHCVEKWDHFKYGA